MQLLSLVGWSLLVYAITYLMKWHLTGILLLFILWTFFYFVRTRGSDYEAHGSIQRTYIVGLTILLVAGLFNFTGLARYGSRLLDRFGEARRLEHSGYYIHPENPRGFLFRASVDGEGFEVPVFGPNDSLLVRPIHDLKTSTHDTWQASYHLSSQPFRVNGVWKNVAEVFWLKPGETIQVLRENGEAERPDTVFFTLRLEIPQELSLKQRFKVWIGDLSIVNRYYFNQGRIRDGRIQHDFEEDVLFSEVTLREGQRFSSLAEGLDTKDYNWSDIFSKILVVRETKFDASSRIGLLLNEDLRKIRGLAFERNGVRLDEAFTVVRVDTFRAGDLLTYGLGHRGRFGIRLTESAILDPLNEANVTSVDLSPPLAWPLPPQRKGEQDSVAFIMTSESDYIPMDGYWFQNGRTQHAFYAKAIFDSDSDSLLVNDGKSIHRFGLEETACVGDLYQGVTVKLNQPKQPIPFAGAQAMLVVVGLGVLFIALGCRGGPHQVKTSRAWTIVWASTLVLLFVRFVLAYRVSLLPPADASELEIQNVFHKSLTVSLIGLAAIPMALIFSRMFIAIRDYGLTRLKWQVLLYEVTIAGFLLWLAALVGMELFTVQAAVLLACAISLPVLFAKLKVVATRAHFRNFLNHPVAFYLPAVVSILWMLIGHSFGRNESFLGFRLSIVTHILVVLTVVGARGILGSKKNCTVKQAGIISAGVLVGSAVIVLSQVGLSGTGSALTVTAAVLILLGIGLRTFGLPNLRVWLLKPVYYHRWLFGLYIILCLLVEVFLIRDKGFFIYGLSFSLAIVIAIYYDRSSRVKGYLLSLGLAAFFLVLFAFPKYLSVTGIITKVVKPNNNIFYRFVALQDSEEEVLLSEHGENRLQKTPFLRNSHHQWQMLLYAAHADAGGLGYGRAPLTDSGMTYPTSMADCVYSIFLLAEHGWLSGLLLISVYLIAGGACFLMASRIPGENRVNFRLVALVVIGGFLMFNALYMAAANIGQLIFTGQNIPFLGLYSVSDLLQIAALLLMLTFLSFYDLDRESETERFPNQPIARQVCASASVAGLVWLVVLGWGLARVAGNSGLREDHDFEEGMFRELERNLPTMAATNGNSNVNASRPWKLRGQRVEKTGVGRVFSVEEQYIRDLNERRNKFDPNAGLYYLTEVQRRGDRHFRLNINRRFFRIRSPMKISSPWDGMMLAAGDARMPTISALGYQFKVSLHERSGAKYISLDDRSPTLSTARAVVLRQSEYGDSFGELVRSGDSLFFQPGFQIPLAHDHWQIFINGEQLRKSGNYRLEQGDLLVFIDKRKKNYRRNLMYLGIQHPILSYVQWRNGRLRRMFPMGSELPMAYTLGLASDLSPPKSPASPEQLTLPLSMKMHTDLAKDIQRVAKKPRYKQRYRGDIHASHRIALTVLDAYSGHVLAMPDYPSVDPNQEDFYERVLEASPSEQRDLLQNHNLKNHAIGSTIKPLVFASLAAEFHGKLDLSKLRVRDYCRYSEKESKYFHNCDSEHEQLANIKLNPAFDCQNRGGVQLVSAADFLTHSRDHYQAMLGMLGLLMDTTEVENVFLPAEKPSDLIYDGKAFTLDLQRVAGEHALTIENPIPILRIESAKKSLLFQGLKRHFQVYDDASLNDVYGNYAQSYLPSFEGPISTIRGNPYLKFALPEPIILYPNRMQQIHNRYLQFLLGAAEAGRWNNVRMAESLARIVTGVKVTAKVEIDLKSELVAHQPDTALSGTPVWFHSLPAPLNELEWRRKNLFEPLRNVSKVGTLKALRGLSDKLDQRGMRLLCKTGTINEIELRGTNNQQRKEETETLLFVLGKWDSTKSDFVPGKTLAGFLYLENARFANQLPQAKNDFAQPILERLANSDYFRRKERFVRQSEILTSSN